MNEIRLFAIVFMALEGCESRVREEKHNVSSYTKVNRLVVVAALRHTSS